jgi:hypothetical protein
MRSRSTGRSTSQDDQAEESRTRGVEEEPKVHAKKQGAPHVDHATGKNMHDKGGAVCSKGWGVQ